MLDRKVGPKVYSDFDLEIKYTNESVLSNGLRVIEVNTGTQEIIKVELVFQAGRVNESKIAAAKAAIKLLGEGTKSKNSSDLAELFDFYGAIVKFNCLMESCSISLVCLNRHFKSVWPAFLEVIQYPVYAEDEVQKYAAVSSQKLAHELTKNDVVSYRLITEKIFGSGHPYGYNTQPGDILSLRSKHLFEFFNTSIGFNRAAIFLSGRYSDEIRDLIFSTLSDIDKVNEPKSPSFENFGFLNQTFKEETKNDKQISLMIGRRMIERKHKDYTVMFFLNTVLGGYFGSRLMKNIREEKGYTYGIYSSIDGWNNDGLFYISSDVAKEMAEPCIAEIYNEINKLKSELIPELELKMVKNFILGQMLNLLDGPFETAQLLKNIYTKNIDTHAVQDHIRRIKNISSQDLREAANHYLDKNTFTTVMAG